MGSAGETSHSGPSPSWKSHFPAGDLWVFGYGSLIWKPPPHFGSFPRAIELDFLINESLATSRATYGGFGSGDHRGTPESPGRVLTVIERSFWETLSDPQSELEPNSSGSVVWGAAYHIPASHAEEVHAYLDDREIDGYTVHYTPFHPSPTLTNNAGSQPQSQQEEPQPMTCMVYIGLPTNAQFLRDPAQRDPASVAAVINKSRGLSGDNRDYLFQLEEALEGLGLGYADGHVADLVDRVKALRNQEGESGVSRDVGKITCPGDGGTSTPDEFKHHGKS